jgi:hypothetical protein
MLGDHGCFRVLLAVLAALADARAAVCPVVGRGARPDGARPRLLDLSQPLGTMTLIVDKASYLVLKNERVGHKTYPDDFSLCPRDGAHLTAQATETEAQIAAGLSRRFRIIRQMGKGGMGANWSPADFTDGLTLLPPPRVLLP